MSAAEVIDVLAAAEQEPEHAAVVAITPSGHHVGILYTNPQDERRFFFHHLVDENLRFEHFDPDGRLRWVVPAFEVDEAELFLLPVLDLLYERYVNNPQSLPFNFDLDVGFEADGALRLPVEGAGFTCAMFVVAIFDQAGMGLVDLSTWHTCSAARVEADMQHRSRLIDAIEVEDAVRADELRTHPAHAHVRASEIAAASGMAPRPVSLARVESESLALLHQLHSDDS